MNNHVETPEVISSSTTQSPSNLHDEKSVAAPEHDRTINEITKAIDLLFEPGEIVEVRGKKLDGNIRSKYYIDHERMAQVLARADESGKFEALWYTLQRIKPEINGLTKQRLGLSTARNDIRSYQWLVIDIDRPQNDPNKKMNATDAELQTLADVRDQVIAWLTKKEFPQPIIACSGNGWHLIYRVLHPPESYLLLKAVLEGVSYNFRNISGDFNDGKICQIDTSLAEPEQVIKAYGTTSRKSPQDGGERPWRQSYILSIPRSFQAVLTDSLCIVAAAFPSGPASSKSGGDFPKVNQEWLEEYGVEHYMDWAQPYLVLEEIIEENGEEHYVTSNCPMRTDDGIHEHSGDKRKTEIIVYPDGGIGFCCFSDECTLGELIAKVNELKGERYPHKIFEEQPVGELLEALGAVVDDGAEFLGAPADALGAGVDDGDDPSEAPAIDESALKYPQLRFPYEAMPEGKLKELTDKACEGGLDPGLVVPSILALVSSLPGRDKMEGVRINLFVTLLALVGAGKDMATDRSIDVLGLREKEDIAWSNYAPSGERSIAQHVGDKPGTKDDPVRRAGPRRRCIVTYELEDTLKKSKGETSGVLQAMQHYYDHNRKVYEDSKYRQTQTVDCRMSWLAGLPVGQGEIDETNYRLAFGENSMHGIGSRMIFGFAEKRVDARTSRNWEADPSIYTTGTVKKEFLEGVGPITVDSVKTLANKLHDAKIEGFAPGVEALYLGWKPKKDLSGRDTFHVLKLAVLVGLINGHEKVEMEDWLFATALMDWQYEIRMVFTPGSAKTVTMGEFKETIMNEVRKRTKAMREGTTKDRHSKSILEDGKTRHYVRWNGMSNDGKWYRFGWDAEKAIESLVRDGHLAYRVDVVTSESEKDYEYEVNKRWIRLMK
jgi:hypothetical protein